MGAKNQWRNMPVSAAVVLAFGAGILLAWLIRVVLGVSGVGGPAVYLMSSGIGLLAGTVCFILWWRWRACGKTKKRRRKPARTE